MSSPAGSNPSAEGPLKEKDKEFLISIEEGNPHWRLHEVPVIQNLPALQGKLFNVNRMDPTKRKNSVKELEGKEGRT